MDHPSYQPVGVDYDNDEHYLLGATSDSIPLSDPPSRPVYQSNSSTPSFSSFAPQSERPILAYQPLNPNLASLSAGTEPLTVLSPLTEDWIQRQQPIQAAQAELRRYRTRRVKLSRTNVFIADYTFVSLFFDN